MSSDFKEKSEKSYLGMAPPHGKQPTVAQGFILSRGPQRSLHILQPLLAHIQKTQFLNVFSETQMVVTCYIVATAARFAV